MKPRAVAGTGLGQVGLGVAGGAGRWTTHEAELLKDVLGEARALRLAVGLGVRRGWEGPKAPVRAAGLVSRSRRGRPALDLGVDEEELIERMVDMVTDHLR